jgi:phage gp46-like protein
MSSTLQGDIKFIYNAETGFGDIAVAGRDLVRDDGLETAILVSLFTFQRADSEDNLPNENVDNTYQGWWADEPSLQIVNPIHIGSKLWLLGRTKFTQNITAFAEEFCEDALNWLITDGVASAVNVTATRAASQTLDLTIEIYKPVGTTPLTFRYFYNWENQIIRSR